MLTSHISKYFASRASIDGCAILINSFQVQWAAIGNNSYALVVLYSVDTLSRRLRRLAFCECLWVCSPEASKPTNTHKKQAAAGGAKGYLHYIEQREHSYYFLLQPIGPGRN